MLRATTILAFLLELLVAAAIAQAGPVVPTGLQPGDQYYLTFLTSGGRNAASTDINDYNSFAHAQAALNPALTGPNAGVQWRAVASTETTNAIDNLGLLASTPIYLLDGTTEVASGGTQGWSGTHLAPINLTQFLTGDTYPFQVWTGTFVNGTANSPLGTADPFPTLGADQSLSAAWVYDVPHAPVDDGNLAIRPFYAVSQLLTVVPEPGSVTLLLAGCAALGAVGWRRRSMASATSRRELP